MYSIAIMGDSGAGKSTSLRNLDPKTTFIIESDCKGLPWRGWRKQYNKDNKNYVECSTSAEIENIIKLINEKPEYKHIKTLVIDTVNAVMLDTEMANIKEKGFQKWVDLADGIYTIVSHCNRLRPDLVAICIFHMDNASDDNGKPYYRIKTNGRKLQKIQLESKFTIVLLAKKEGDRYIFETQSNFSTAKSPMGLFNDLIIDNDMKPIIEKYQEYENDFPFSEKDLKKDNIIKIETKKGDK